MSKIQLYNGDCLEIMDKLIKDGIIVDAVITDPPYGSTICKWDNFILFEPMWDKIKQLRKDSTPIILFGSEPFASYLRLSNIKEYKYDWIWDKVILSGMMYARYRPMSQTENILVFGKKRITYILQMILRNKPIKGGGMTKGEALNNKGFKPLKKTHLYKNPINLIKFKKQRTNTLHPTQKPVELLEYLIKTYTNESDTVLDFTMGSGTTGVACKNLNRDFIGIELDQNFFNIACERIGYK